MKITIEIDNPEAVAHRLADLACWWEGFKIGLRVAGIDHFIVAENGIDIARDLKVKIDDACRRGAILDTGRLEDEKPF